MKFRFTDKIEFELEERDFKAGIPLILAGAVLYFEIWDKSVFLLGLFIYYLLYFSWGKIEQYSQASARWLEASKEAKNQKRKMLCPSCGSRKIILQGYQNYKSDELHAFYLCLACEKGSIMTEGGLH